MEIIQEGRNFRLIQDSELSDVLVILDRYLPESLKFQQTIKTYLNDRVWKFYFYVAKNWPEEPVCLHFPGCTLTPKGNIYGSFGIFCPSKQIECVDLLETEDILIDWKLEMYLNFTHIDIMNRLNLFYERMGYMEKLAGDIYTIDRPNESVELESLPIEEVEMRPLTVDNVKAIHDLYPASEIECVEVFEKLINALPGYGIFTKDDGELCAWMMHSYYGAMFSMQTRPEFRRKGFGIHLAQALTRKVIERGYTPFVVIRPENDASRSLYTKLGFQKAFNTVRVTLIPRTDDIKVNGHHLNHLNHHNHLHHHNNNNNNNNNRHNTDNEDTDTQKDEGIEDMRVDIPENRNRNTSDVLNDEGIAEDA